MNDRKRAPPRRNVFEVAVRMRILYFYHHDIGGSVKKLRGKAVWRLEKRGGLIPPAAALGRGDPVVVPPLRLREADEVRFCVANTGPALSAAELHSMFRQFWQAGDQDKRGAGLGMSICRSIIEAHGDNIWAEPEPGKRVRICFAVPLPSVSSPAGAV